MANTNKFSAIQIGLASLKRFANGLMVRLKNLKLLTIVLKNRKRTDYFVKRFLVLQRTGNVVAVNTKSTL